MTMPSPDQERQRMAGVYSAMSEDELKQIAQSGDEELCGSGGVPGRSRRGLKLEITPRVEDVFEFNETVAPVPRSS
jgi:hypothetical protein